MYLDNKYTKWYYSIIQSAKANPFDGYTEKHHIIPKSLGGSNKKENLVVLSARQHFICHWLLTKMVEHKKHKASMYNAWAKMLQGKKRYTPCGRIYELARTAMSKNLSGKNSPFYGVPKSKEHRENMSKSMKGRDAWNKGVPMREESKEKLRKARAKQIIPKEQGEEHSKKMKGRKWFHIGDERILVRPDDPILKTRKWKEGNGVSHPNPPKMIDCQHCGRTIAGAGNYARYHGDKCKSLFM